jgi:hypothetical protein
MFPELIDVQARNTEIHERLSPIVAKDPGIQFIVKELKSYVNCYQRSRQL